MDNHIKIFSMGIIWFGVAISVSEIEAGISIASLSTPNTIWLPLILGHILGGIMLFFVGLIGARLKLNAMETTTTTYGKYGSKFFATLNVLQLVAWVAVLNAQGAMALSGLNFPLNFQITCIILALLVAIWVYIGVQHSSKITTIVMTTLTILLAILSIKLLGPETIGTLQSTSMISNNPTQLTFWNIFELSIAMPISWLPVISDYTKDAEKPVKATLISAIAYTIASLWMYFIGIEIVAMGANYTISQAILITGLGIPGIIILVLSTVTTNFIATNSAGESAKAIIHSLNPKIVGIIVSILSAILAISGIMNHYINFLYLIASVFAPMAAVLMVSYYLTRDNPGDNVTYIWNIIAWLAGFIVYQLTVNMNSIILGPTLLAIIVSASIAYINVLIKKNNGINTMIKEQ